MVISVNTGGRAEVMLTVPLETRGGEVGVAFLAGFKMLTD